MKQINDYLIKDIDNSDLYIKCRVESNPDNSYDTTYYFHDGDEWIKDFIDITKIAPADASRRVRFDEFITQVHDYMVHGNLWDELGNIKDSVKKDQYKLVIENITE